MSHSPFYHNATVDLYVYRIAKYASASGDVERKTKKMKERGPPPPVCLDQRCRHLEIRRRQERKWRVCPIVVTSRYCCGASSGLPPLPRRAAECWREMSVSLV